MHLELLIELLKEYEEIKHHYYCKKIITIFLLTLIIYFDTFLDF